MTYFGDMPLVLMGDRMVRDFLRSVDVDAEGARTSGVLRRVRVLDGERPDLLSTRLYGVPSLDWTFFLVNEGLTPATWPTSQRDWVEEAGETLESRSDPVCCVDSSGRRIERLFVRRFFDAETGEEVSFLDDGDGVGGNLGRLAIGRSSDVVTRGDLDDARRTEESEIWALSPDHVRDFAAEVREAVA